MELVCPFVLSSSVELKHRWKMRLYDWCRSGVCGGTEIIVLGVLHLKSSIELLA